VITCWLVGGGPPPGLGNDSIEANSSSSGAASSGARGSGAVALSTGEEVVGASSGTLIIVAKCSGATGTDGQLMDIEAEAEVEVDQLVALRGLPTGGMADHPEVLVMLTNDILDSVELRIEQGIPRLLLALASSSVFSVASASTRETTNTGSMAEYSLSLDSTGGLRDGSAEQPLRADATSGDEDTSEIVNRQQEVEIKFYVGTSAVSVVRKQNSSKTDSSGSSQVTEDATAAAVLSSLFGRKPEVLPAVVTINSVGEETISVSIRFLKSTEARYKPKGKGSEGPALEAGSEITVETGLPSIMIADKALIDEFVDNICMNLRVDHNPGTGENTVTLGT